MKTLDEVIKEMECCIKFDADCSECPDLALCTGRPWRLFDTDALTYLKEYKDYLDMMCALPDYYDWVHSADNPPLTWEQLKQMEGKPAWVEEENQPSQWYLIGDVETDEDDYPEFVSMIVFDCQGDYLFYKYNMGTTWKAYRKERE